MYIDPEKYNCIQYANFGEYLYKILDDKIRDLKLTNAKIKKIEPNKSLYNTLESLLSQIANDFQFLNKHCKELFMKHVLPKFIKPTKLLYLSFEESSLSDFVWYSLRISCILL